MPVSDTVAQAKSLLEKRLSELDSERKQVQQALAGLAGTKRGPGRPKGSGGGAKRRRRRGGNRADQAVRLIGANPGISVSELAKKMKLKAPNYLYRVLPDLEKEGRIAKKGKGYFPGN